jgi:hypothetical protein
VRDALHTWDPSRTRDLKMSRARVGALIDEKHRAERAAAELARQARNGDPSLPQALHERLAAQFSLTETYVRGLSLCAEVCVLARWTEPEQRTDAGPDRGELDRFAAALNVPLSYLVNWMLDVHRLGSLSENLSALVGA